MILNFARWHIIKKFLCTRNLCPLYRSKLNTFHCSLCFSYKENMLYFSLIKRNRPIGRIIANRSWNLKSPRKFCVNTNFFSNVQVLDKFSLNTLFSRSVSKNIILNGFFCKKCLIKTLCILFSRKDVWFVFSPLTRTSIFYALFLFLVS